VPLETATACGASGAGAGGPGTASCAVWAAANAVSNRRV
jgi:hypothetical protein